jgi:hypothetical protein
MSGRFRAGGVLRTSGASLPAFNPELTTMFSRARYAADPVGRSSRYLRQMSALAASGTRGRFAPFLGDRGEQGWIEQDKHGECGQQDA